MKFDFIYVISVLMIVISTMYLGYTVLRCYKNNFEYKYKYKIKNKSHKIIALDYKIYLDIRDYVTYEKLEIWRFYFPA